MHPTPGEDTFINEESHFPSLLHVGRERHWVDIYWPVMLFHIYGDPNISCGLSGRNGRFNCCGMAMTTNSNKHVHSPTRLPEQTPSLPLKHHTNVKVLDV